MNGKEWMEMYRKRSEARGSFVVGSLASMLLIMLFTALTKIVLPLWLVLLIAFSTGIITHKIVMKSYRRF